MFLCFLIFSIFNLAHSSDANTTSDSDTTGKSVLESQTKKIAHDENKKKLHGEKFKSKVHSTLADGSSCYLSADQSGNGPTCTDSEMTAAYFQTCTSIEYLCCSRDQKETTQLGSGSKAIPYFPSTSPKAFAVKADGTPCYWALAATPSSCAELNLVLVDSRSCSGRMEYLCCPRDK